MRSSTILSNNFDKQGITLTSCNYFCLTGRPFLYTGTTSAYFNAPGKVFVFIDLSINNLIGLDSAFTPIFRIVGGILS